MTTDFGLQGKLLITGHTGFKGTWLTLLAQNIGMEVVGISLPPEKDSLYFRMNRQSAIEEYFIDINKLTDVEGCVERIKPNYVLHLAAQALVEESYSHPLLTFQTNVMGTANVLTACLKSISIRAIGVATTDKVYRNDNLGIPFVETDALGGKDPYSASKVGTECVIDSWRQLSDLQEGPPVVSLRAGNVIGGGDMAANRIIPDLVRSKKSGNPAVIRNAESTRPWQHVLDPLVGYLKSLQKAAAGELLLTSLNFGPTGESLSVSELVAVACKEDQSIPVPLFQQTGSLTRESKYLSLDSSAATASLSWSNKWTQEEAIRSSIHWWKNVDSGRLTPHEACLQDIKTVLS